MEIEQMSKDPKHKIKQLSHYVDFTRVKHGSVGYQIEDYRSDVEFIYMFAPLIWFLRCIGINIFLLGGTNMKSGQFYAYMMIEGAYLYYLVKSKVKASKFENILSYFNEGSQIVYVLLQLVSYFSKDQDFKQKKVGMIQAGIIVFIMVFNIGYTFGILFRNSLIRPLIRLCKKRRSKLSEDDLTLKMKDENFKKDQPGNSPQSKMVVSTFRTILQNKFSSNKNDTTKHISSPIGKIILKRYQRIGKEV